MDHENHVFILYIIISLMLSLFIEEAIFLLTCMIECFNVPRFLIMNCLISQTHVQVFFILKNAFHLEFQTRLSIPYCTVWVSCHA